MENEIEIIYEFANQLIENSTNIDSEFIELVNNNFWGLF